MAPGARAPIVRRRSFNDMTPSPAPSPRMAKERCLWREKFVNIITREEERTRRHSDAMYYLYEDEDGECENGICASEMKDTPVTVRQKVNTILDPGTRFSADFARWSKKLMVVVQVVGFLAIVVSVVLVMVESMPQNYKSSPDGFFAIESICVCFFTIELGARFWSCCDRVQFCTELLNWFDFLSILPYYLALISADLPVSSLVFLRCVRLVKVLRVLKVGKVSENLQYVGSSLVRSLDALYLLFFLILISTVLFSSAMYLAETSNAHYVNGTWMHRTDEIHGENVESKFQSIPGTFWWALVTLCTVGYGDYVPQSTAGKMVAACTMLVGTLVVAFPVILIGANFNEIVFEKQRANNKNRAVTTMSELRTITNRAVSRFASELKEAHPEISAAKSEDAKNNVVTSFSFNGKMIAVTTTVDKSVFTTYRYTPPFQIARSLLKLAYSGDSMLLSIPIILDAVEVQEAAHSALVGLGGDYAGLPKEAVYARAIDMFRVSLSGTDGSSGVTLLTSDVPQPSAYVNIVMRMRPQAALLLAAGGLPTLALELHVHWKLNSAFVVSPRVETAPEYEITLPIDDLVRGLDLQSLMDVSSSADDESHPSDMLQAHNSLNTGRRARPGDLSFVSTTRSVSVCGTPLLQVGGPHTRSFFSATTCDSASPLNPLQPPSRASFASQATGSGGGGGCSSGPGNV